MEARGDFARRATVVAFVAFLPALPALAGAQIGLNFTGTSIFESGYLPPDTMGAVGSGHIVELINGRYRVYDKATGSRLADSSLDDFWISGGAAPVRYAFDPRVLYDPFAQRYYGVAVDNHRGANGFLVAVSRTANPLDGWAAFRLDADTADDHWADFPRLGFDADGVYVAADMYALGTAPQASNVLVLPKSDLLAPTPTVARATLLEDTAVGTTAQPVVSLDNTPLPQSFWSVMSGFDGLLRTTVTGTITAPSVGLNGVALIASAPPPPDADQPGSGTNLETNNSTRFSSNVVLVEGSFWAVQNIAHEGAAALRWLQIRAADNAVLQSGTLYDPLLDFYYPSIAVNPAGDVVIGASGSGESQFASAYAFIGHTADGVTAFDEPLLLKAGVGTYERLDSIGRNRWGDYSATVVDPEDPRVFWTFQEWASGTDAYSTQITQLIVPEPATILLLAAGAVLLRRRTR